MDAPIRTALYRHYSSDGTLLYVGISIRLAGRLIEHQRAPWFQEVEAIRIEWHESRDEAIAEEARVIKEERHIHNVLHSIKEDDGCGASIYHGDAGVIDSLGGPTAVAAMLGYDKPGSVQRVQNWKYRGIPEVVRLRRQDIFGPAEGIRHAG